MRHQRAQNWLSRAGKRKDRKSWSPAVASRPRRCCRSAPTTTRTRPLPAAHNRPAKIALGRLAAEIGIDRKRGRTASHMKVRTAGYQRRPASQIVTARNSVTIPRHQGRKTARQPQENSAGSTASSGRAADIPGSSTVRILVCRLWWMVWTQFIHETGRSPAGAHQQTSSRCGIRAEVPVDMGQS